MGAPVSAADVPAGAAGRHDVVVQTDVEMTAPDGVVLRANVYRPWASPGGFPALLMRTPYGKDGQQPAIHLFDPVQAAAQGWVVVVQDCRGRFRSDGVWRPYEADAIDGAAAVEWVAAMPWSNGRVGMYGSSYQGSAQLAAASLRPPSLRAIAPMCCWFDSRNGQTYRGGALELGKLARWTLMNMGERLRRRLGLPPGAAHADITGAERELEALADDGYSSLPLAAFGPVARHDPTSEIFDYVAAGPDGPAQPPLMALGREPDVPTMWISGWYDAFLGDAVAGFARCQRRDVPTRLVVGPWTHVSRARRVGGRDFGPDAETIGEARQSLDACLLEWFAAWVGADQEEHRPGPSVAYFVMGENRWRDAARWPPSATRSVTYALTAGGSLTETPAASLATGRRSFVADPDHPIPTRGGCTVMAGAFPPGPFDQSSISERADVLLYRSEPLSQDLVLAGPVSVDVWLSSTAPDADVVARLLDLEPAGTQWNLADGVLRAGHRDGGPRALLPETGSVHCAVDLWSTASVLPQGHRVGLLIAASSFPRWDRNLQSAAAFGRGTEACVACHHIWCGTEHPSALRLTVDDRHPAEGDSFATGAG